MEERINIKSALDHANRFVGQVADQLFKDENATIKGEELPKVTPIRKINFLLIYILLQSWKTETQKLKSPYFNFESDQVQKALQSFMNTLSQNIEIEKDHFSPLLKKSFQLVLLYFNSPLNFLNEIFEEKVSVNELGELNKFLKSDFIGRIITHLEESSNEEIKISALESSLLEPDNPEQFETDLSDFLDIKPTPEPVNDAFVNKFKVAPGSTINDQFKGEDNTINDLHAKKKDAESILESHAAGKVESILENIPLNEQFQITKSVFGGMKSVYDSFIDKVDASISFADATLLVDEFVSKTEHEELNKYLNDLVERKFMS